MKKKTEKWIQALPPQKGKTAIVTGSNTGLGKQIALYLSQKGAKVIIACRNQEKGQLAKEEISKSTGNQEVSVMKVDLSDFDSIHEFSASIHKQYKTLDILVNNAGVMIPPFSKTSQGLELQIGVNFFGHFLLTALLFPAIENSQQGRIVTMSSIAARQGNIDEGNFRGEKKYKAMREYSQSKLADLIFALELHDRLKSGNYDVKSIAAHPGVTLTDLQRHSKFFFQMTKLFGMLPPEGALPAIEGALAKDIKGGEYIGPGGFMEMKGYPDRNAKTNPDALNIEIRKRLWSQAERITGVKFLS